MSRRLTRPIVALGVGLLIAFPLAARTPEPTDETVSTETEPAYRWLNEVRVQRRIRQERRRTAVEEAIDAHRRWINPRSAARQEQREQEVQRRRDALLEHITRDREVFRNQIPWQPPQDPWQERTPGPPGAAPWSPTEDAVEAPGETAPWTLPYPPPVWNNHWYYRGF